MGPCHDETRAVRETGLLSRIFPRRRGRRENFFWQLDADLIPN